jgi:type II secretory pathway pseudopilin PulG
MMRRRQLESPLNITRLGRNGKGFTLVELVVVMGIFIVFMMMVSSSFESVIKASAQQSRSAKSQIEGVVGLEILRTDLSHAGYALPWDYSFAPGVWPEVTANPPVVPAGIDATVYKEETPRAIGGGVATNGTDYLVLKSGMLADSSTSVGRFDFVNYSSNNTSRISRIGDANSDVRAGQDRVISILSEFTSKGVQSRKLLMADSSNFSYTVPADYLAGSSAYMPADSSQSVYVYAIGDSTLRMPYNRADYFMYRTTATDASFPMPSNCSPGTGILFKAVAGQNGNYTGPAGTTIYPLLNCVGDLQVTLGFDPANNGNMSYYALGTTSGFSDADFRTQLKEARVYILAHEGGKDPNFIFPGDSIWVGEPGLGGREWTPTGTNSLNTTFGTDWRNYRWKVYSFTVQLKNLQ